MKMTNEEIQAIMNSTFSGLALFCRDLDLGEDLISKYQINQILMERGMTDVSHKIGGFGKNCRYLIASSKGKDLSMFSQNPGLGHILIQHGAFFKVLDIQKENGKTQILLLNIPKEGVPIFGRGKASVEEQIIEKGKEAFKACLKLAPVQELQSKDWVDRTSFPIGMNQEGAFFIDMKPNDKAQANPGIQAAPKAQKTKIPPTPIHKKVEAVTTKKAEAISTPKSQPKEKKKGFWSKLFGK